MEQILDLVKDKLLNFAIRKLAPKLLTPELLQYCSNQLDDIKSGIDILRTQQLETAKKHLKNALTILKHDIKHEEGKHMLDEAYNNAIGGSTTVDKIEDKIESMRLVLFCLLMKFLIFASNNVNEKIISESIIFKELCQTHLMELNTITDVIEAVEVELLFKWGKIGSTANKRFKLLTSILKIHLDVNIIFFSIKYRYIKDIDLMSSSLEMSQMTLNENLGDRITGDREFWDITRELSVLCGDNADMYVHAKFLSKKPHKISVEKFSVFDIYFNLRSIRFTSDDPLPVQMENPIDEIFLQFLNILFMNIENSPEYLSKILENFENYPIMVEKVDLELDQRFGKHWTTSDQYYKMR